MTVSDMKSLARVLLPLLVALVLLAWGATALLNATARSWFERDVALRARLAVSGARDALVTHFQKEDRRRLAAVLEEIARDDRIMAAEACNPQGGSITQTKAFPRQFACEALRDRVTGLAGASDAEADADFDATTAAGERVHVTALPVKDGDNFLGSVVLVHEMGWGARRELAMQRVTLAVFAVFGLLASLLTILTRRVSWSSWTEELKDLLRLGQAPVLGRKKGARGRFQPLVADLRQMVAELASEQSSATGGRWSAERLQKTVNRLLHGEGVVVVANREPYIHDRAEDGNIRVLHPASGLVTALEPVMRACSGTWVAHGSGSADRETVDRKGRVAVPPGEASYALRRVWLSREEELGYYYGFANEGLWPLCHNAHARPTFRADDWRHYQEVNRRFADAVCEEVSGPDPIVLVQDYHFALAPQLIRKRLPLATVITFWHIPWPNAESFGICPWARELLEGLLGSSIVGFHTQLHCNNFIESVDRYLEARIDREAQGVVQGGRDCLVRSYPISIDWPNRWAGVSPPAQECRREVFAELGLGPDAVLGVGADRLDYTKGVEERLLAVERLLERFPHLRGRFTFVQLAAPSRTLIERYRLLNESVEALATRINQRFAEGSYRPIVLLRSHHEPLAVFRYLKAADVCYVSSLHDGMNLVAKEFVAARDDERGVLVLSRFTGAARELTEALVVNPYDLEEASAALATAIEMPAAEQGERMRAMRSIVSELNVYRWAGRMLADAARIRQQNRLSHRLAMGLRVVREAER
jgi:trehalose 6-phosphate synthase